MKEKTCTFIGHRDCCKIDKKVLEDEIFCLIEKGVTDFLFSGMGMFDWLSRIIVSQLKQDYKDIRCILVIPHIREYLKIKYPYYDEVIYLEYENYGYKERVIERNRYMADKSAYAICYVNRSSGDAVKIYRYAKKQDLKIIDIPDNKYITI